MRDVRIRPEQLADTIKKELDDLAEDTTGTVKKVVQEAADTVVKDLKAASPKHTGKYVKSWTQKKVKDNSSGKAIMKSIYIIYSQGHTEQSPGCEQVAQNGSGKCRSSGVEAEYPLRFFLLYAK
ncbi:HK97 gp10 family phage protein [Bilifractor sp. HCP3S3_D3]|uniref:HK97 gp10 family phage protein n=1 Tax=Bilifractor sp. HCP3S3_D3 TaxID=3438907 RepID=UPI003F8C44E9